MELASRPLPPQRVPGPESLKNNSSRKLGRVEDEKLF